MKLATILGGLRTEKGWSQEFLAEKIGISRQTVAKWESGSSLPDLKHFLKISDLFQVSLDFLVKDNAYPLDENKNDLPADELLDFIVEAKKRTYASNESFASAKQEATRLLSKDLAYEKGDYKYWDTYVGGMNFSGSEVVWYQDQPVWSMNYYGKNEMEGSLIMDFLMKALNLVSVEVPYRGPKFLQDGKFTYINSVQGNYDFFRGKEKIFYQGELVYELDYIGGKISN